MDWQAVSVDVAAEGVGCWPLRAPVVCDHRVEPPCQRRGSLDAPDLGLLSSRARFRPMFRVVTA